MPQENSKRSDSQKFGIRSFVEGKTIQCFFEDDLFDRAKEALGRRVYIFDLIRQRLHGPKINIQVKELRILPAKEDIPPLNDLLARIRRES